MVAAIDIGTNTVLLLIASERDGKLVPIREEQRVPRLGRGVDASRKLSPENMQQVLKVLSDYRAIIAQTAAEEGVKSEDVLTEVTATSAVRDAANRDAFLDMVKKSTGYRIRLLTGPEEAERTFTGALSALPESVLKAYDYAVVLDIGGGSTEFAAGVVSKSRGPSIFRSVDAGCVRFSERFLNTGHRVHPEMYQVEACREAANAIFNGEQSVRKMLESSRDRTLMIGVAGTVTTLAYMEAGHRKFDAGALNGMMINRQTLGKWITYAASHTPEEMVRDYPVVMEGRADIVLSGLIILDSFLKITGFQEFAVSAGGIRHGTAAQLISQAQGRKR